MSKLSPYRKSSGIYLQDYSPATNPYNENKINQKRTKRPPIDQTNKRYYNDEHPKLTEKKRYDQIHNIDIDHLLEKNNGLANQNAELYMMLEQRGKIIVALEKKLQAQVRNQIMTLEAIEFEKGKFIAESHKKFKDYQRRIEELIEEIYLLNHQKQQGNFIKAKEMELLKETFNHQQLMHFQSIAQNNASARQISEIEKIRMKSMLQSKNNEIAKMSLQFQTANDKLKNQIIGLNNEIVHLHHMKKMELSEQKMMYEGAIDNLNKDHIKQKEILIMGHNIELKKLNHYLANLQSRANNIGEQKKIGEIQQNTRELELLQNKNKLQNQIQQIEDFHRRTTFEETQRLKDLNKNEIAALQVSNQAITNNLKTENQKLKNIISSKSQQIDRLLNQISTLRKQHSQDSSKYESMIEELKEKLRQMERDYLQEEQRLKIKYGELREADIRALKQFYQHQIQVLSKDLYQKSNLANKNRNLLHEQLHQKNQMRKNFDIEILKLNSRISELQLEVNERMTENKQQVNTISQRMQMTSDMLLRESKDKERVNQINEEQKKRLQQLILNKDKEIQQLNAKISLINKNHLVQISHKNAEIELLKKDKDDIETELKKEKYFYDNQIKKKDILLKNNKEIYNNDLQRLKANHRDELQTSIKQSASKINILQVQLNKYRALEKNLKNQVNHLNQSKSQQVKSKSNQLQLQKQRMFNERKESLQKLQRYYQTQMGKLNTQIGELKKQLAYKQQDIRNMTDKYHRLQQKLQMVLESQQKLKNMENRIVALGQDNNLVKNIAEMMKSRNK